jgi:hypothetical protein
MALTPRGERMMATRKANEEKRIADAAKGVPHPKFYFIEDDYNMCFRVWKNTNFGDQFACIPYNLAIKEFIERLTKQYPEAFVYGDPQDE